MTSTYIHVGYPKCASTYLQKRIFPQVGNYSDVAFAPQREKFLPFLPHMNVSEFREMVQRRLVNPDGGAGSLVISCEDYVELHFREFEQAFFREHREIDPATHYFRNDVIASNLKRVYPEARIIIVVRNPMTWFESRYKMLYRGYQTSLPPEAFVREPIEGYAEAIEKYQALFGAENLLVVPFELLLRDRAGFVAKILDFMGVTKAVDIPAAAENRGVEMRWEVEFERSKKRLRQRLQGAGPLTKPLYALARTGYELVTKPSLRRRLGDERFRVGLGGETGKALRDHFAAGNRRVESLTGLDLAAFGYD